MKKALIVIILILSACGCSSSNQQARIAEKFLTAYFGYDLQQAIELADDDTRAELEGMKAQLEADNLKPEDLRANGEKVIIEINNVLVDGDSAICNYTVKMSPDDANAMTNNLILVKKEGTWKVNF